MRTTPLLCLFLLLLPAIGAERVDYPAPDTNAVELDLIEDAGDSIHFYVDVAGEMAEGGCLESLSKESDASSAALEMSKGDDVLTLGLYRKTVYDNNNVQHIILEERLDLDHKDLHAGSWDLALAVQDRFGVSHDCGDDRTLVITAVGDETSPTVTFPTADSEGIIRLGAGQTLSPRVEDATLGRVEYRVDRMPVGKFFVLKAPYLISWQSFFPGENELTLRATDRAGNAATEVTATVLVDGDDPIVSLDLLNRTRFYAGVDNPIELSVQDVSDYVATVTFQDKSVSYTGSGGIDATVKPLTIAANTTGKSLLHVSVVDAFGNRATITRNILVEQLTTDARIVSAKQETNQRVIAGENATILLDVEQETDLADVNFTLRLDGKQNGYLLVPAGSYNTTTLETQLAPGRHSVRVEAILPENVLGNATNLTVQVPVEVYLARVLDGNKSYHLRSTNGLPDGAVAPNGTILETRLVQQGASSVYVFEADGKVLFWDPSGPREQTFTELESTNDGNDSPGVAPAILLATLAALAVALRRR